MKINKNSSVPLYIQVSEWIKYEINKNSLKSGDRVPSENEIMELLQVSRGTIKKAVDILIKNSILEQIQGKGTYVKKENISYQLGYGLQSFAESLTSQKINFATQVITQRVEKADEFVSNKLQISEGSNIFYMERIRSVEDEKIMLIENRINLQHCPNIINIDFTKSSLFDELESLTGKKIEYSECKYSAKSISSKRADLLKINANDPVLHLEQLVFLENDIPIEFGNVWLKSNVNYLGTTLRRK